MKRTLPFLASLTFAELGVEEPDETTALMAAIVEEERQEKERAREREEYVFPRPTGLSLVSDREENMSPHPTGLSLVSQRGKTTCPPSRRHCV